MAKKKDEIHVIHLSLRKDGALVPDVADVMQLYSPDQTRDKHGRFEDEGKGRPGTTTYYHVTVGSYHKGEALVGRDYLVNTGRAAAWKWGHDAPEGFDGHGVSLFKSVGEARDFQDEHGGTLLRVHVPNDFIAGDHGARQEAANERPDDHDHVTPRWTKNSEGYPFIDGFVPGSWVESIEG